MKIEGGGKFFAETYQLINAEEMIEIGKSPVYSKDWLRQESLVHAWTIGGENRVRSYWNITHQVPY